MKTNESSLSFTYQFICEYQYCSDVKLFSMDICVLFVKPGQSEALNALSGTVSMKFTFLFSPPMLGLSCYAWAFSSCGERGLLFVAVRGLLIVVASHLVKHRPQAHGLQQLQHAGSVVAAHGLQGARASQLWRVGSKAQAHQLWRMGLVVPQHMGSSQTRDQTHVPCIGRQILNHCATREVPEVYFSWGCFLCFLFPLYSQEHQVHPDLLISVINRTQL